MDRLNPGEEPAPYSVNGADVNFGAFEAAIMVGVAWALEIPPEILMLSFNKNYSASQAAVNEFWMLLRKERARFGAENNDHIYEDWFISELLLGKIEAAGFLEATQDPTQYDVERAWLLSEWIGPVKPATDTLKQANGFAALVEGGWTTNARAARLLTGSKFSKNIRILAKENALKMEAQRPFMEAEAKFGQEAVARAVARMAPTANGRDDHDVVDDDTRN
jgi:capsid protein